MYEIERVCTNHNVQSIKQEADIFDHQITAAVFHAEKKKLRKNLDTVGLQS